MAGTFADETPIFDGIACNDRHMTTNLDTNKSSVSFGTPTLKEWSRENTIEFWFKVNDKSAYKRQIENLLLFSMVSTGPSGGIDPQQYYQVYISTDGELKCAPFGNQQFKDPILTFTDFRLENEDEYAWWHVSCSYKFGEQAKGTLFNTNVVQARSETMIGLPKFYPTNSLRASFGRQAERNGLANFMVKEFRFWNK